MWIANIDQKFYGPFDTEDQAKEYVKIKSKTVVNITFITKVLPINNEDQYLIDRTMMEQRKIFAHSAYRKK